MKVLFDVDETLVTGDPQLSNGAATEPNKPIVEMLKALAKAGHEVWVSSGGGLEYAVNQCDRLGISKYVSYVAPKDSNLYKQNFDLSIDDMPTNWASINLQVYTSKPSRLVALGHVVPGLVIGG